MVQYVNAFSCAKDNVNEDFIINFMQNLPVIQKDGVQDDLAIEPVTSVIMGKSIVTKLVKALEELLEEQMVEDEDSLPQDGDSLQKE